MEKASRECQSSPSTVEPKKKNKLEELEKWTLKIKTTDGIPCNRRSDLHLQKEHNCFTK